MKSNAKNARTVCNNKKATYEYFLEEKIEAGVQLFGTEIKSVFEGQCSLLGESFVKIIGNEAYLFGFHISPYHHADGFREEKPDRDKKLLLHKVEINKLRQATTREGYTIVPTRVYFAENGRCKVEIALAKGKKLHDKRETAAKKSAARDIDRAMKGR